jgi:hypothetical protein
MEHSTYLAQLLGPTLAIMGAALAANPKSFRNLADEFLRSPALIFLAGLLAFVPGLAIVLAHNVWVAGWPVLITVLGWLSLIGGAFRIVAPGWVTQIGRSVLSRSGWTRSGGIAMIFLAATLIYFGYFAR